MLIPAQGSSSVQLLQPASLCFRAVDKFFDLGCYNFVGPELAAALRQLLLGGSEGMPPPPTPPPPQRKFCYFRCSETYSGGFCGHDNSTAANSHKAYNQLIFKNSASRSYHGTGKLRNQHPLMAV